ncbi:MAG: helix-turn-helix transcriptional regulator [Prevotella sp.]|nr:helix-turn-helix transcriptional regulator [Prevotella sp.]
MKDRIRQIMESQHMTQQVFADYIGLGAATLSSIFNGRTRPTLNVVEAIKKKIPNISTDWLMFGSGEMYLAESDASDQASAGQSGGQETMLIFDSPVAPTPQTAVPTAPNMNSVKPTRSEIVREEVKYVDKPQRRVIEIRVFYDDQTWDTFVPAKK